MPKILFRWDLKKKKKKDLTDIRLGHALFQACEDAFWPPKPHLRWEPPPPPSLRRVPQSGRCIAGAGERASLSNVTFRGLMQLIKIEKMAEGGLQLLERPPRYKIMTGRRDL